MKVVTFNKERESYIIYNNTNYTKLLELVENDVIIYISMLKCENEYIIEKIILNSKTDTCINDFLKRFGLDSIDDFNEYVRNKLETDCIDDVEYVRNGVKKNRYDKVSLVNTTFTKCTTLDKKEIASVTYCDTNYTTKVEILEVLEGDVIVYIELMHNGDNGCIYYIDVTSKTDNSINDILKRFGIDSIDDFNEYVVSQLMKSRYNNITLMI